MKQPKITPTPQSLFGDLDLELPALDISAQANKSPSKKAQAKQTQPEPRAAALAGQGFLPGLSKRGRPRLKTPISAVERTAEHRRKRLEAGAKRLEMILDREVSNALDALAEHFKEPRSEVISTLILKTASRVLKR